MMDDNYDVMLLMLYFLLLFTIISLLALYPSPSLSPSLSLSLSLSSFLSPAVETGERKEERCMQHKEEIRCRIRQVELGQILPAQTCHHTTHNLRAVSP